MNSCAWLTAHLLRGRRLWEGEARVAIRTDDRQILKLRLIRRMRPTIMERRRAERHAMDEDEAKFIKSMSNKRTENRALELLLDDRRFQRIDLATKLRIIEALPVRGE